MEYILPLWIHGVYRVSQPNVLGVSRDEAFSPSAIFAASAVDVGLHQQRPYTLTYFVCTSLFFLFSAERRPIRRSTWVYMETWMNLSSLPFLRCSSNSLNCPSVIREVNILMEQSGKHVPGIPSLKVAGNRGMIMMGRW